MLTRKFFLSPVLLVPAILLGLGACGGDSSSTSSTPSTTKPATEKPAVVANPSGVGEYTNVDLNAPLLAPMVDHGKSVYEVKCAACHKLTDQRVVGPGWKGVTDRRKPEWIMNMVTNVDVMLSEDPEAQKMLAECLVRMPNQNLSAQDARDVLEFMYANDGLAVAK